MNYKYLTVKIVLKVLIILILSNNINALSGTQIIDKANDYKNHPWICNDWNARSENKIIEWDPKKPNGGRDIRYPFYPKGVELGPDPDGEGPLAAPTATGQHTGVAYGWGLRETREVFDEKLTKIKSDGTGYLAGNHDKTYEKESEANLRWRLWYDYTGIDCSGLVWNSMGLPPLPRSSSPYSLCRFNTTHIMNQNGIFSDEIEWDTLKKGDILIKDGHVAIVSSSPAGNRVNVIEAGVKWSEVAGGYKPQVVENYYEKTNNTIFRGRETNSTGYQPRRFSPPYLKRLALYVPVIKDGKVDSYTKIYEREWRNKTDGSGLEIVDIIPPEVVQSDELYVEAEFTKAMAVHTDYGSLWENTEIKMGKTYQTSLEFSPINTEKKEIIDEFNSGKKIEDGWGNGYEIDNGVVFTKWIGKIETKYFEPGEYNIYVSAKSLMQDELDSNPATKAKRTDEGGWEGYEAGVDTNHKFIIIPKGAVLYSSRYRPVPSATPYLDRVVIKDLKQEPTEEPTEASGTVTPAGSAVPSPTPEPEIKVMSIDKYLKGVLLALVGNADFSDEKYLDGFKAMGIAAYTLLLYEIQKNTGYDIAVNGYTGSQNYYIPYTDFDSAAGPSKNIISVAIDGGNYAGKKREGILLKIGEGDAARYYIKAFWFDAIKNNRGDFESDVMIDGNSVKWPKLKTILFSYAGGKSARNVIIQSALNVLGKAETYARKFSIKNYQFSIKEKQMKIKKT